MEPDELAEWQARIDRLISATPPPLQTAAPIQAMRRLSAAIGIVKAAVEEVHQALDAAGVPDVLP